MDLANIIDRECCSLLQERTKTEVIIELADRLAGRGNIDIESLKKELNGRILKRLQNLA